MDYTQDERKWLRSKWRLARVALLRIDESRRVHPKDARLMEVQTWLRVHGYIEPCPFFSHLFILTCTGHDLLGVMS